ncbi:sodium/potassium/calcium exchanger 4 isoform X2 [Cryptotermes secundus]|uniref:sodium/potassium/calcium exchanger 4 isoform X2 n=1 Tax=Cryptotermes secundus TaxID=105785 RepID=UPI000CD7ACE0|nr:sodium/potassium/calcium exchanger 4 isoform X2 [Cryptotermes secundus]
MPTRMTELRLIIIVVSIILTVQFVSVKCTNNTTAEDDRSHVQDCMNSSVSDFPDDLFDFKERKNGAIIVHFFLALYCFTIIAVVCNDYFLPSVDCICTELNLTQDVAGATFMAVATSSPELFVNIIGTFITESDLGVGTVVGSAVFNTLGVAACIGLAASKTIILEWWPLTRDCSLYIVTIGVLTAVTLDEKVEWYEALILFLMYITYFLIMWGNGHLMKLAKKIEVKIIGSKTVLNDPESSTSEVYSNVGPGIYRWYLHGDFTVSNKMTSDDTEKSPKKGSRLMCPPVGGLLDKVWNIFLWPISLLVFISIPDCRKNHFRHLYPLTFIMCIVWIATASYLNAWMMTIIGNTLGVPDSVMGLTMLAAGGSLPEAFSSIIMARKGVGAMGISSSVGANTLNILLCLGTPWFIKCIVQIIQTGNTNSSAVNIISEGVTYNCFALLSSVLLLYVVIAVFKFHLGKLLGFTCLVTYFIFITVSVLIEMNVFFYVNRPLCAEI